MKLYNNIQKFLSSNYNLAIYVVLSALGWCFNFAHITLLIMAIYACLSIIIFDRFDSILFLFLGAPYIVGNWTDQTNMLFNFIAVGIAIFSVVLFIVKQIFIKKIKAKKGRLFYYMVPALIVYLLGGVIGHFQLFHFVITFAVCLIIYTYYWITINFVDNPEINLNRSIIAIGFLIICELVFKYATCENIIDSLLNKPIRIGAGEINTSAIYLGVAMLSCFYLGFKKNKFYKYLPIATLFLIGTFFTYSRIALAVNTIMATISIIWCYFKTKNKTSYLLTICLILCSIFGALMLIRDSIDVLIEYYLKVGFDGNGRSELWSWCFALFKENIWFGAGFTSSSAVPSLDAQINGEYLIYAHNIIFQLLTSLGIVGLIGNLPLIIQKYITILKADSDKTLKLLAFLQILTISLCGMFDASGGLGIFMAGLVFCLIGTSEKDIPIQDNKNQLK